MAVNYNACIDPIILMQKGTSHIDLGSYSPDPEVNIDDLINDLFSNGELGFAYDYNDFSTMFQDQAGTIPITAAGQKIKRILDKSGNAKHAMQYVDDFSPTLQYDAVTNKYYADFDGTNDFLATSAINLTSIDSMTLMVGMNQATTGFGGMVVELSPAVESNAGSFSISSSVISGENWFGANSRGTSVATINSKTTNTANVIVNKMKISTSTLINRLNGIEKSTSMSQGTGSYGNYPLFIGSRAGSSIFFKGRIYCMIGIGRLINDAELDISENILSGIVGS